jgi:hypothetical protein
MLKYGTKEEKRELSILRKHFKKVIDPSQLPPQRSGYEAMQACFELIESSATALAFSTYRGHIGRGVYQEINLALARGLPVFQIRRRKIEKFAGELSVTDPDDWSIRYARVRAA